MTFNIRTSIGRDGNNVWPNRKELVAETIRRSSPHLVGLQEALTEQIEYLASELPEYRWLGIDRGLNGGNGLSESTPIFYRHAELSPIESGNFWLSDTPDAPSRGRRGSRIVTWARFHHIETRQQIYVFNTHFTLRRGQRQLEAAELINERIAALPSGSAVIVTGDFNAVAGMSDTWRTATGGGLDDAWLVADATLGPPVTFGGFGPPREGAENRIDWILVGGPVGVSSVETILHNEGGRFPSDHYPVVARLEIGP
jgi:endonuclease/exonuclease/phosphatase family metal-dependent hydrolase